MILLTGATGYLGSQIARELIAQRRPFRILGRDPSRLAFNPVEVGVDVVTGDLRDPSAVRQAVRGVEAIIHTAALVKTWVPDRRHFWQTNVQGLTDLLREAAEAGVRRIVYTSSFIALGPSSDVKAGEELRHRSPYANDYEETKAQALVWLRNQKGQFPVVTLLPGVIYGPGPKTEANLVGGMIEQYLAGKFPGLLGSGEQRWSFAYNGDVVAAHLAALDRGVPGEEYLLAGDNRSLNDFFRLLTELSGVHHRVLHLPFWAGKLMGEIELMRAKLTGLPPQVTPGVVEIFKHDWVYSGEKAVRQLGYHVTPLEEGLAKTLEARHG
jgi:farnesol dehydrogenase